MFPARHSIVIAGGSTAGMVEFSCYLASSYLQSGQNVLFIAADVPPSQLRRQLARFGVDASGCERGGELVFIECRSTAPLTDADTGHARPCDMGSIDALLGMTEEALSSFSDAPARVILYSVTPMFMYHDLDALSIFLETLSLRAKQYGSLTAIVHNDVLTDAQVEKIETAVDGVIDVKVDDDFRRYVRIRRMEGLSVKPAWVPLETVRGEEAEAGAFLTWRRGDRSESE